jgi:NAD(P)-dependent dehydrogenase (short-subunit alcohol dehydrogenase family)
VGITLEQFKEIEGGKTILKRVGQPPEVARVIAFLAVAEASYITAAYLPVDGGRRVLS